MTTMPTTRHWPRQQQQQKQQQQQLLGGPVGHSCSMTTFHNNGNIGAGSHHPTTTVGPGGRLCVLGWWQWQWVETSATQPHNLDSGTPSQLGHHHLKVVGVIPMQELHGTTQEADYDTEDEDGSEGKQLPLHGIRCHSVCPCHTETLMHGLPSSPSGMASLPLLSDVPKLARNWWGTDVAGPLFTAPPSPHQSLMRRGSGCHRSRGMMIEDFEEESRPNKPTMLRGDGEDTYEMPARNKFDPHPFLLWELRL